MAKSRSESLLRGAFALLSLRGAEIPRFTRNKLRNLKGFAKGKTTMPGPGRNSMFFVIARSAATKQSQNGQPEMRQALK